jgi:F0F1-type ATP synthase assembly protein I
MDHDIPDAAERRAHLEEDSPRGRETVRGELAGMDLGMRVLSYLIAGVLVYGGLGWVGDHYLGTGFLLPLGIVLGAAGGCYVIIRRYGQVPQELLVSTRRRTYRKAASISDRRRVLNESKGESR